MNAPFGLETENGTSFWVRPDGKTEILRADQPACEVPTADLIEAASRIQTDLPA